MIVVVGIVFVGLKVRPYWLAILVSLVVLSIPLLVRGWLRVRRGGSLLEYKDRKMSASPVEYVRLTREEQAGGTAYRLKSFWWSIPEGLRYVIRIGAIFLIFGIFAVVYNAVRD